MNLPEAFTERMKRQLGEDEYQRFSESLNLPAPVSIRLNPFKLDIPAALKKVPWCSTGCYLPKRPLFASDPLWHCGAYYVQEASSMMIEQAFMAVRQVNPEPMKVLDLCAAPGGKSTHLASMLGHEDVLVCNEVIRSRVPVLYENITKHGYPNVMVTNADSADFATLGELFDLVLVDAPCSGEGLFRKDPEATSEWNPENVNTCELRQKRILENIAGCIKPGGYLIYSTCTYNPGENDMQAESLEKKGFEPVPFSSGQSAMQCYPHRMQGEGFFIALLRKNYSQGTGSPKPAKSKLKPIKPVAGMPDLLLEQQQLVDFDGQTLSLSHPLYGFYTEHLSHLPCYSIGVKLGAFREKTFFPSEYLPFSTVFNRAAFPVMELDHSRALSYLSRQTLMHQGKEKGHVVLCYKNQVLGLGKYAGNRINNLFPNEWRLRSSITEDNWFSLLD